MSSRSIVSLAASVIVSIACIATVSTDAFAYRRGVGVGRVGVYHGGVYRGGVYRGAAVRRGEQQELTELIAADTIPIDRATEFMQNRANTSASLFPLWLGAPDRQI
jgi:hypothetical protein